MSGGVVFYRLVRERGEAGDVELPGGQVRELAVAAGRGSWIGVVAVPRRRG
ncbi:MAG: hypothetical protein ABSA93_34015 [Streptosporangiaceae bacterium]